MSGIPVYTTSPITTGSKASGITPQTSSTNPNPGAPTATATRSTSSYTPAQPGAAPVPGPTASAQRYTPLQPTPTVKTDSDGPPPPQPGAFPVPLNTGIPPPPKIGEKYQSQNPPPPQPAQQPYPPQMSIPPPNTAFGAQPPASSTGATTTSSSRYPVAIPAVEYGASRQSLEHPPGYHQNTNASELTSDQRRAQGANNSTGLGGTSENVGDIDAESIWNTAKQWASTAGSKISETEAEIWRRINKQ